MSDLYHRYADAIADDLLADPELFDPVSAEFASNSDEGYGEWMPAGDDTGAGADVEEFDAACGSYDVLDRRDRALTEEERSDLDELGRVMTGPADRGLLSGTGRGAYVHHDDDDSALDDAGGAADGVGDLGASKLWWRFGWFDGSRRSHRLAAIGVAVVVVLGVVVSLLPSGGEDKSSTTASTTRAFTVPTMTQSPPTPSSGNPAGAAADGPIGIKRADSRCTAGSTDPMQAFDSDVNTAWMCVPAYGVPGTVLRVEFDNWYVVTGVSIVPGWNRVNPDGSDEWLRHKTAATVEYQFNDPDETRLTQQTNNIRDEVVTRVQPPVLASAMTITITEFGTPTGAVADTKTIPGVGGVLASDTPKTGDLKDFAISSISIIGHRAA
ncbi:hypothetical protein F0Q45_08320 [Mycobacterium simiae]|uniref:F5/8 type C domain-containing protein n=1 Tax=Mycobacterium simiae TaxID=1784 RepID=A0A5B1BU81_MYCSI|nr:hypothetical protein [Mycobacterium simiae]KAA1250689.1 hypothetical protein F0Q45_08320 [Mycobacterium simiae]